MQVFLLINGDNQNRIRRIQQLFSEFQAALHERKPFAVTVSIIAIHIVVVVFPVLCAGIVGRVDIDAVHLTRIQIFQKLQGVIVVRFNQRVPKIAIRCIAN